MTVQLSCAHLKSSKRRSPDSVWPLRNANGKTFAEQKASDQLKEKFKSRKGNKNV